MKIKIVLLISFVAAVLSGCNTQEVFMFSYFKGNGEDGLHLAYSMDGKKWESLNDDKSFLTPEVGQDKLMRDPCVCYGPDGLYHMVWTVSWGEKGVGYANSKDLINWSEQIYIPVMDHEQDALNCWAPEITYDHDGGQFFIYWSTTIPGRFPETGETGDNNYNHRMYYTTTKDFQSFSETNLLYDGGFNVIDGTITKVDNEFYMVLKDETRYPEPEKNLRVVKSKNITGPWSEVSAPITGDYWAEGPSIIKTEDGWNVYFDKYTDKSMGAVFTPDWKNWKDISDEVFFHEGVRHGTVFKAPIHILENINSKF